MGTACDLNMGMYRVCAMYTKTFREALLLSPDAEFTPLLGLSNKFVVNGQLLFVLADEIFLVFTLPGLGAATEGANSCVIDICQGLADSLRRHTAALVVETGKGHVNTMSSLHVYGMLIRESLLLLEVVVNLQLVSISETVLVLVVSVAKVMTMAGRREWEAKRVVWRRTATV